LTLASLILENTGLLKAGNQPTEFDPEKGGVVRFEDVLGCDEAKDVSRSNWQGKVRACPFTDPACLLLE